MKRNVKIVIGAGYGDEGKGNLTYLLSKQCEGSVLNILFNGGPQRGHTVNTPFGRYTHNNYGSASSLGVDTYYAPDFIVNPLVWFNETRREDFNKFVNGKLFMDSECLVTTPYDMLINQAIETQRGEGRHGSCGLGVWETKLRSMNPDYRIQAWELPNQLKISTKMEKIYDEYVPKRCEELGISVPKCLDTIVFVTVCKKMSKYCGIINNNKDFLKSYENLLFEGSQGLFLSEDNKEEGNNVTASKTGLNNPTFKKFSDILKKGNVEVFYITRCYSTRHGNGKFSEDPHIIERLNITDHYPNYTNEWQGNFKYGKLDVPKMMKSIQKDTGRLRIGHKTNLAVSWSDYSDSLITTNGDVPIDSIKDEYNWLDSVIRITPTCYR